MMSLLSHCHGEKTKDEIQRNEGLEGKAYTLHAYSKAMKRKVRFLEDNTDNRDNNSQVATSL